MRLRTFTVFSRDVTVIPRLRRTWRLPSWHELLNSSHSIDGSFDEAHGKMVWMAGTSFQQHCGAGARHRNLIEMVTRNKISVLRY
jgi:hypothetical protein